MKIEQQHNQRGGEFFIQNAAGEKIAELTYLRLDAKTIDADHTYVDSSLRGQGIADKLYQQLRQFVAKQELNLQASCSYIAQKLARER